LIDRRWLPLNALRAFEAVAQRLNFTAGAQALGVSQSAISRHIISLEGLLGAQLFERRPQGLALTAAGTALLPVVAKSFDRMEQSLNEIVSDGGGQRTLRVHLPPSFAQLLAVPLLRDLRRECPGIALDMPAPARSGHHRRMSMPRWCLAGPWGAPMLPICCGWCR
jgi:LysR family glycine cleavage system transcriptional activator